jgi:hypothetical protein
LCIQNIFIYNQLTLYLTLSKKNTLFYFIFLFFGGVLQIRASDAAMQGIIKTLNPGKPLLTLGFVAEQPSHGFLVDASFIDYLPELSRQEKPSWSPAKSPGSPGAGKPYAGWSSPTAQRAKSEVSPVPSVHADSTTQPAALLVPNVPPRAAADTTTQRASAVLPVPNFPASVHADATTQPAALLVPNVPPRAAADSTTQRALWPVPNIPVSVDNLNDAWQQFQLQVTPTTTTTLTTTTTTTTTPPHYHHHQQEQPLFPPQRNFF